MKSHVMAGVVATAMLIGTPILASTASAQPAMRGDSTGSTLVTVIIGAAAGATVGALLWPASASAVVAAGAPVAASWGWGAFISTRAAVGAVIGGGLGYLVSR